MSEVNHSRKINFRPLQGALAKKLILAIVIASSSLAFIITAIQLYVDFSNDLDDVSKKLADIESGYSNSITESVWLLNDEQISRQLKGLTAIPGIFSAVINVDGKVRWKATKLDTGDAYPKHYQQHRIPLVKTYKNSDRKIGELVLSVSIDDIYLHLYDKALLIFFANALKTFIVSVFLFFFFYFFITRHLYKLSEYAKDIKLGTYIEPLQFDRASKSESKKDELDHLSDAINIMRDNLVESYVSVSQINEKLKNELAINKKINAELAISKEQVVKKESELDSIINNLVEGVIVLDDNFTVLRMNHAGKKIFKYDAKELTGVSLGDIIPELDLDELSAADPHDVVIIESLQNIYYGIGADGHKFPLRLSLVSLPVNGSSRYICSCLDITKELQKEEQLQRSRKMEALGNLTGGIAHDYNNMLGVVLGYAELLEEDLAGQKKLAHYVEAIKHASERGAKLTQKLLAFSRHDSSDASVVNINELLLAEQHMLEKTLTARIKLTLDLQDNIWPVWLDSGDFEDAVLNMSINAMHAIRDNGFLTIETRNKTINKEDAQLLDLTASDYILLTITDTGCGMDEVTRDKIFDPFYTTKGDQGTGLGLSQVYGFVERSSGIIRVDSVPGGGTSFELYFPRYCDGRVANRRQKIAQLPDTVADETILVVDDEPALLELTTEILSQQGYTVIVAQSVSQALALLESETVDVMLSDIIMPEMDGYQLAAIVQEKYPSVKIQLASGLTDSSDSDMKNSDLYRNLLKKPYDSQTLLERIRTLLEETV